MLDYSLKENRVVVSLLCDWREFPNLEADEETVQLIDPHMGFLKSYMYSLTMRQHSPWQSLKSSLGAMLSGIHHVTTEFYHPVLNRLEEISMYM